MSSLWETPIVADGDHKAGDIAQVRIQTEQPDTAAARLKADTECQDGWGNLIYLVHELADALDAARAERDRRVEWRPEWQTLVNQASLNAHRALTAEARAEAAEARGAEVYDQLQDARRRIAAALAIHKHAELGDYLDGSPMPDVCLTCQENNVAGKKLWPCPTVRALTEGTDQ